MRTNLKIKPLLRLSLKGQTIRTNVRIREPKITIKPWGGVIDLKSIPKQPNQRAISPSAYRTFIKRRGKWYAISQPTTRESALDIGAAKAVKTLAASFKIMPVKARPIRIRTAGEFQRYAYQFRTYQVKRGRQIPLKDTFIQYRTKRLTRGGQDVREIISSRGGTKWL